MVAKRPSSEAQRVTRQAQKNKNKVFANVMLHRRKYRTSTDSASHRNAAMFAAAQSSRDISLEQHAANLRDLLQESGPLARSFALYLSSRIDFLPAEYCRALASVPDSAPSLSLSDIEKVMVEELGPSFHRAFQEFDSAPFKTGLIDQTHAAVLSNGNPVTVCVLRQECVDMSAFGILVAIIRKEPLHKLFSGSAEAIIADFRDSFQRTVNLHLRGQAVESCADTPEFLRSEHMRKFYRELSTKRVLTFTRIEEKYINQLLRSSPHDSHKLAISLCQAWLREALYGRYLPVDVRIGNIAITESGNVVFNGHEFVELPQHTKENLRHYLLATLVDDPDRAALHLLQEMHPPRDGMHEAAEFRSKFRQAAYFGALEPVLGTDTNALAQLIFQHWKTALEFGYKPTPDLLSFYRGLFSVARAARELAPADDPLREGLEELDADVMFGEFVDIAGTDYWSKNADKFAMALANLPQTLDEAINRAAGEGLEDSATTSELSARRGNPVAVAVLFIAAVAFLVHPTMYRWPEQGVTLALMIAGLLGLQTCDD
jgi:predicted unusual protein kinase regulating ubiquinone biosynthesis (AarF/ABC1/UbiB family)